MKEDSRKQTGRIGLSKAIDYFTIHGYTVSLPLNDTQYYDLVVEKDTKFYTVQCKATKTNNSSIDFRNTGGTKGCVYANSLDDPVDYFFCIDKDFNCYLIPRNDLLAFGTTRSICLKRTEAQNKQGFPTYKYYVK